MRKALIIALGLASLSALASAQPAEAAGYKCVPVNCHWVKVPLLPGQHNLSKTGMNYKSEYVCGQSCTTFESPAIDKSMQERRDTHVN